DTAVEHRDAEVRAQREDPIGDRLREGDDVARRWHHVDVLAARVLSHFVEKRVVLVEVLSDRYVLDLDDDIVGVGQLELTRKVLAALLADDDVGARNAAAARTLDGEERKSRRRIAGARLSTTEKQRER